MSTPGAAPVALVVGGASGLGAASAAALGAAGHHVVTGDLAGTGADLAVDVTDEDAVAAAVDAVVAEHGGLDVVVNSAGVSTLMRVVDHDASEFRRVLDVNLTGGLLVLKHAARVMTAAGRGGAVVSIASLNARQPGTGMAAYCSAKAGLAMLTQVAALELGPSGIRVNAVSPGLVVTPLTAPAMDIAGVRDDYVENTPLGRAGTPEEVAEAVVYLATARWLTGEVLDLNGGAHLQRYPDLVGHVTRAFG
ncbi:NAD(P)-dependent dehydrogenase (short-subunit alcohol dehydrogenase family) [Nocardioides marinisabuli]|uniref:NAD(P)-dependent dehydrogenase (Short-subunit alcohol dehydrogenase family) n=1 Tax=Nocardioides marinisabuli TaxID=419476 RepID=A0A7Y9JQM2_9ACTN|nr:SDR family oxidoreductase [Nocardioides marinisabuli]NYD55839.1 NAD(P)-dependent dehydrogenase (short-subunit alcohol dehydrogenase family) [Nocardioides marinisabuli]